MRQLQLDIEPILDAKIGDFAGPNWNPVIDGVRQLHAGLIRNLYIYGAAGTGKSHLLSAICDSYLDMGKTAIQVSLLELIDAPIDAIQTLDTFDLVALDDVESICNRLTWQHAIFHLMNLSLESSHQLVFSSRFAPTQLQLQDIALQNELFDIKHLAVPDGQCFADRSALLQAIMLRQGLQFDEGIQQYLLCHGATQTLALLRTIKHISALLAGESMKLSMTKRKQIFGLIDEYAQ